MKMARWVCFFLFAAWMMTAGGCAQIIADAITLDDASYSDISAKTGKVPEDQSRVWVYVIGGRDFINTPMEQYITFNEAAYPMTGNAFFKKDVLAGDVTVSSTPPGFWMKAGKNRQQVRLEKGAEYFMRVAYDPGFTVLKPPTCTIELVNPQQAIGEMSKLKHAQWSEKEKGRKVKLD